MDKQLLDSYIALGRTQAAQRAVREKDNDERVDEQRRFEVLEAWRPLLAKLSDSMPPEFGLYIVGPVLTPTEGLNKSVRPLVIDLTPLGLGPLGAVLKSTGEIGWLTPHVITLSDTGEQEMYLSDSMAIQAIEGGKLVGFYEALAALHDIAEKVRTHNETVRAGWVAFNPWNWGAYLTLADLGKSASPDLYAALAHQGGGCYPVVRIGNNSERVHAEGREAAVSFGVNFGADDWERHMAVHTFTFNDIPDDGELYGYVALIPVNPSQWREVMGGGEAQ